MALRTLTFEQACRQFPNRYTLENVPTWAFVKNAGNGRFYAPQYRTDREWYENTAFHGEPGHVGRRNVCVSSNQSWPMGQWIDRPFNPVRMRSPA